MNGEISRLMVVNLDVKGFSNSKLDKEVTAEVISVKGAENKAARVTKTLINPMYVTELNAAIRAARGEHEALTMPYLKKGLRLLTVEMLPVYVEKMTKHKELVRALAKKLGEDWADAMRTAPGFLGGLHDQADYGTGDEVADSILLEFDFSPVPDAESVRKWAAHLSAEQVANLEDKHRENLGAAFKAAHEDVVSRVIKKAKHFLARTEDKSKNPSSSLHETALTSLRDILSLVQQGLGVAKDEQFDALINDLSAAIDGANIVALKTVESERASRSDLVRKALNKFEGVF